MAESFALGNWGVTSEDILKSQYPMHRACRDGDVETLAILLSEGQHSVYEEDSFYGWTPAHWAAYFGKLACLRKLMTGVAVNCSVPTSRFKQTPGHLAAFGGHPQCLLWLVQSGVQIEMQDYLGETAIHKAARTGSMECVGLLASHGANLIVINNNGHSCSQLAAMCGHTACAEFLEENVIRQRSQGIGGVPSNGVHNGVVNPATHDVTSGSVIPCVPIQTSNGQPESNGQAANGHANGFGDGGCDDEMECSDNIIPISTADRGTTDITLDTRVSQNIVPIGGRKRSREEIHEVHHKRARVNDVCMDKGMDEGLLAPAGQFAPGFTSRTPCMPTNGFGEPNYANGNTNVVTLKAQQDDHVAYDYNGIMEEDLTKATQITESLHASNAQKPSRCAAFNLMGHYI